jgi:hypothetical protein
VYCAVQYVSNRTAWQVALANQTTGQYFMLTLAPSPQAAFSGNTTEWIMEAPDFGLPTSSLPIFHAGCIYHTELLRAEQDNQESRGRWHLEYRGLGDLKPVGREAQPRRQESSSSIASIVWELVSAWPPSSRSNRQPCRAHTRYRSPSTQP